MANVNTPAGPPGPPGRPGPPGGPVFSTVASIKVATTQPEELLGHWVSDEQLEMLRISRRDGLLEAFWACLGIGLGAAIPAINSAKNAFSGPIADRTPLDLIGFVQLLICVAAILIAAVLIVLWCVRGRGTEDLITEIRGRKRAS